MFDNEVAFQIKKHIGVISCNSSNGWTKEINIVSWNGNPDKIDIRDWSPEHDRMNRGITLYEDEAKELLNVLTKYYS